jgi:hypothetical protein
MSTAPEFFAGSETLLENSGRNPPASECGNAAHDILTNIQPPHPMRTAECNGDLK